jgi:hypothetical protein
LEFTLDEEHHNNLLEINEKYREQVLNLIEKFLGKDKREEASKLNRFRIKKFFLDHEELLPKYESIKQEEIKELALLRENFESEKYDLLKKYTELQ